MSANVDGQELALRTGTSQGIMDVQGLLKSAAQQQAEQQAAAQQQTTAAVAPQVAKGAMDLAKDPEAAARIAEGMNGSQ
jgi:hypothetical protein